MRHRPQLKKISIFKQNHQLCDTKEDAEHAEKKASPEDLKKAENQIVESIPTVQQEAEYDSNANMPNTYHSPPEIQTKGQRLPHE